MNERRRRVLMGSVAWLFLVATTTESAETESEDAPKIHWGPRDEGGLQFGIRRTAGKQELECFLRNQDEWPAHFNDYFLGYFEALKVQVRSKGETEWYTLPRLRPGVKSAGPSARNNITLAAGKTYLPNRERTTTFVLGLERTELRAGGRSGVIEVRILQEFPDFRPDRREVQGKESLQFVGTLESGTLEIDYPAEMQREAETAAKP